MPIDPKSLQSLSRDQLIAKARELGAKRPELLTRPELRDEILRLLAIDDEERQRARGWFGVARDLVASVVSQGLNLQDTAELIRGAHVFAPKAAPPVATVTLAEIYAAQGHLKKALDLLDEVIEKEPDHEAARQARDRWSMVAGNGPSAAAAARVSVPQPEEEDGPPSANSLSTGPVDSTASAIGTSHNAAAECAEQAPQIAAEQSRLEAERAEAARVAQDQARLAAEEQSRLESARLAEEQSRLDTERAEAARVAEDQVRLAAEEQSRLEATRLAAEQSRLEAERAEAARVAQEQARLAAEAARRAEQARLAEERAEQERIAAARAESARLAELRASLEAARAELARTEAKQVTEDRVLLVRQSRQSWLCAWQFSRKTLDRVSCQEPDGVLNLRLIAVQPSWDGPVTVEKNVQLPAPKGHITLELERPEPEIRVAIGWLAGERFIVLGLGTEFAWDLDKGAHLIWSPPAMGRGEVWQAANAAAVTELMKNVVASVAS